MNPRHELVNWDGAAGLTIDEAIDWLSHCHHSQQVSQNQVNKDVFLQHVVRRFRWVFALAWGQDRIVIAFLQKWLQFMSTYSKHNQTISSRGKRRHAWSLFLNKCCKRWWFIAWQSQTLIIQSHVIDLRQYTEWVISLYQYLHFWLEGQDDQVAVKSQPVLSDSETFSEVDGDTQPLNIIKKKNKQWSKSTKESSLREKNIVLMNEKLRLIPFQSPQRRWLRDLGVIQQCSVMYTLWKTK